MQIEQLRVRPIRPEEYAVEARLVRAAYAAGPYGAELDGNSEWERAEQDTAGRDRDGRVLVAVDGDRILGAASVLRGATVHSKLARDGEAELRLVAVDPSAQGRGIGEMLVRSGLEEALKWGVNVLRLDTGVRNPAQRLYERIGFARTPELDASLPDLDYGSSLTYEYQLQLRDDVRVREIRADEISVVSEFVLAAYRDDYEGLDEPYLAEIADVARRVRDHLVLVAEDVQSGELIGTITAPTPGAQLSDVARAGEMDIRLLGVAHGARGRGIGELLTRSTVQLAAIRGATQLVLNTSKQMAAAWQLYERLGFVRLHEREFAIHRVDGSEVWLRAYGLPLASGTATVSAA